MKDSPSRSKYAAAVPATAGRTKIEEAWLRLRVEADEEADEEGAVERLVDDLRQKRCGFLFRVPLGEGEYKVAMEHAINCLERYAEGGGEPKLHHMGDWVEHVILFIDPLLVVYGRDVREWEFFKSTKQSLVYEEYKKSGEKELRTVGDIAHCIYRDRGEFKHRNIIKGKGLSVAPLPKWMKRKLFTRSKGHARDVLNILVPLYREAYPESCEPTQ